MPTTQTYMPMAVTTPLGKDVLLLEKFSGTEAISQPFRFQLNMLATTDQNIAFEQLLGQQVAVQLCPPGVEPRYFYGIVNRMREGGRIRGYKAEATFIRYSAELVPPFWLLTRSVQSRIFQQQTVPDILNRCSPDSKSASEIQGDFQPRDYCVQYRETDFDFASRLMEEEGIYYFFKHTDGGHQMVLANTPQSHPDVPGPTTINYAEGMRGVRTAERIASSWEKSQEMRSGKHTLWDHCFEMPDKHLETDPVHARHRCPVGTVTHKLKVGGNDQLEIYDYPGGYAQRFDGVGAGGGDQPADLQKIFQDNIRTVGHPHAAGSMPQPGHRRRRAIAASLSAGYKFTLDRALQRQRRLRADAGGARRRHRPAPTRPAEAATRCPTATPSSASPFALPFRPRAARHPGPASRARRRPWSSVPPARRSSPTSTAG